MPVMQVMLVMIANVRLLETNRSDSVSSIITTEDVSGTELVAGAGVIGEEVGRKGKPLEGDLGSG
jgi:hypothetical protein